MAVQRRMRRVPEVMFDVRATSVTEAMIRSGRISRVVRPGASRSCGRWNGCFLLDPGDVLLQQLV